MKLLASFLPLASASWIEMNQLWRELRQNDTRMGRQLSDTTLQNLNEYGCWCYFDTDHGRGKGQPINEVDGVCKVLHEGYDCAIIDWSIEKPQLLAKGQDCIPWEVSYNSATDLGGRSLVEACLDNNRKLCPQRACMIEGHFILSIYDLMVQFKSIDKSFLHSNGFNPTTGCLPIPPTDGGGGGGSGTIPIGNKPPGSGGGSPKPTTPLRKCCGEYPVRFPYETANGNRRCCVDKTYLVKGGMECCNGSVQIYGSC